MIQTATELPRCIQIGIYPPRGKAGLLNIGPGNGTAVKKVIRRGEEMPPRENIGPQLSLRHF
jgi:hypothetical protein